MPSNSARVIGLLATLFVGTATNAGAITMPLPDDAVLYQTATSRQSSIVAAQNDASPFTFRLPNNTRPIAYDIHLTTNVHLNEFPFSGQVAITLTATEATRTITLHQRRLTILSARLTRQATPNVPIVMAAPVYVKRTEMLTFTLATAETDLMTGERYVLTIAYDGELRDDNKGFYRSSYVDASGVKRWLATTQFEWTDARHAFPCYDEPALRAEFRVAITHGRVYHAISNMPTVAGSPVVSGDLATTTFEPLPNSPTYLVAFIVSDFESISAKDERGFVQRIFARPTGIRDGDFGLSTSFRILHEFEQYLGIDFALPKMDHVAVPDFYHGAMENWGLITYREEYLLYSAERSTFVNQRNVARIIAHEYAHQWFGNLVTLKWWSYSWLNEGFATLFENLGVDAVFPQWKIFDAYVATVLQNVMIDDSTPATRPMTHYLEDHDDLAILFDNIAYPKAGSVLRMFMHALTEASFKKGLTSYLKQKQLSDATEDELFAAIETFVKADGTLATNLHVPDLMSSWTHQAGFPVLTVTRDYSTSTGKVSLAQQRYYSTAHDETHATAVWSIPINTARSSSSAALQQFDNTVAEHWLTTATGDITVADLKADDWLLLNHQQTGYYRIQYDERNYAQLAAALLANHTVFHVASRSQLLDDAFEFARTGRLSYAIALDVAKYLLAETEYVPWASAWRAITHIDRLLSESSGYDRWQMFGRRLIDKLFTEAGLVAADGEHHYRKEARVQAIQWACEYGHDQCLTQTAKQLSHYLMGHLSIHQDQRAAVLCNGARNATDKQMQQLMELLQTETDVDQRNRFIQAMACSTKPHHLRALLESSLEFEQRWLSEEERYSVFREVANRRTGFAVAVEMFRVARDDFASVYGRSNANAALRLLAQSVNSDERNAQFDVLVATLRSERYMDAATFVSASETIESNVRWIADNHIAIVEWLEKNEVNSAAAFAMSSVLVIVLICVTQLFQ